MGTALEQPVPRNMRAERGETTPFSVALPPTVVISIQVVVGSGDIDTGVCVYMEQIEGGKIQCLHKRERSPLRIKFALFVIYSNFFTFL